MRSILLLLLFLWAQAPIVGVGVASATEPVAVDALLSPPNSDQRALFNYQMFCQGCHVADGSGHKSVPQLKGFMHKFMATQQGREYLIRVPGAANAALDDEQLTEVLNWMLRQFGDSSNGLSWRPFAVSEIRKYRQQPLNETIKYREAVIAGLKLESES